MRSRAVVEALVLIYNAYVHVFSLSKHLLSSYMNFLYFLFSCVLYSILKGNRHFNIFQSCFHASPRLVPRTDLNSKFDSVWLSIFTLRIFCIPIWSLLFIFRFFLFSFFFVPCSYVLIWSVPFRSVDDVAPCHTVCRATPTSRKEVYGTNTERTSSTTRNSGRFFMSVTDTSYLPSHMDMIAKKRRTSSSATGLRNLGPSARMSLTPRSIHAVFDDVLGEDDDANGYDGPCLPDRPPRKFLPSQRQAMALLCMALPREDCVGFQDRLCAFATGEAEPSHVPRMVLCATQVLLGLQVPMAWRVPSTFAALLTCFHRRVKSHLSWVKFMSST